MNENQLLEAIRQAMSGAPGEDGLTVTELCRAMGYRTTNERPVRDALRLLQDQGKAECVSVVRVRMNGVTARTFGYRLKP